MKVISIIGARPQFIKLAPLSIELRKRKVEEIVIHSGQHYDFNMSKNFLDELLINKPKYNLKVGSGTHGYQTSKMLYKFENIFKDINPSIIIVFGDTNTTLAAALAAAKMYIPIAHIEAGLRSFNKKMPEEINRILTDHVSKWCFAPTKVAMKNLKNENLINNSYLVGDIMYDSLLLFKDKYDFRKIYSKYKIERKKYYVATIHRQENTDIVKRLVNILKALSNLNKPVIFPMHPRTVKMINVNNLNKYIGINLKIIEPCSYLEMISMIKNSKNVITDSGGIQKEAYILKIPCITLRDETEWTETVNSGWNFLCPPNKSLDVNRIITSNFKDLKHKPFYGDGNTASRICRIILNK